MNRLQKNVFKDGWGMHVGKSRIREDVPKVESLIEQAEAPEAERELFGYAKSLAEIQKVLQEEDKEPGAYYCSYPSFIDCSSLLARNGKKGVLLICTLEDTGADEAGKKQETVESRSVYLCRSIRECLRRADIYTRYSPRQYLALLMETDQKNILPVLSRITCRYQELSRSTGRELSYKVSVPGGREGG